MRVYVEGAGLLGPGLNGWQASHACLVGNEAYVAAPTELKASELLPAAERRRTGVPVKLSLAVGQEAFANAQRDPAITATVFTSSGGDGDNLHHICETLAVAELEVSPTRFHNSVHNAAAGYWCIATHSQEPSTSLCCYDASFSSGLLETATQIVVDAVPVALLAYDHPYPEPLHAVRHIGGSFGVALVLTPEPTAHTFAVLDVSLVADIKSPTPMTDPALEALRASIPAARALPLLAALARKSHEVVFLEYIAGNFLRVEVQPC